MRNLMNSDQSYTGLVQKYIGSAYDNVLLVARHIEMLEALMKDMNPGDLKKLLEMADALNLIGLDLLHFRNHYYGSASKVPTSRPNGDPSQPGDMFFNLLDNPGQMYLFNGKNWEPLRGKANTLEEVVVGPTTLVGDVLKLTKPYVPSSNSIEVFVNGAFQVPASTECPDGAYEEVEGGMSLKFPGGVLVHGDVVVVLAGSTVGTSSQGISVQVESAEYTGATGTLMNLPEFMVYTPGINNLEVFVDGVRQTVGVDYAEGSDRAIRFIKPPRIGSTVTFKKGELLSNTPLAWKAEEALVLSTAGEVFHMPLITKGLLVLKGLNQVNDGGFGIYVYDASVDRATADGVALIDPTMPLSDQGKGVGKGVWVRQISKPIIDTRQTDAAMAPISGAWNLGDKVWNSLPSAGAPVGWVCVLPGTPGMWKEFGTIAA